MEKLNKLKFVPTSVTQHLKEATQKYMDEMQNAMIKDLEQCGNDLNTFIETKICEIAEENNILIIKKIANLQNLLDSFKFLRNNFNLHTVDFFKKINFFPESLPSQAGIHTILYKLNEMLDNLEVLDSFISEKTSYGKGEFLAKTNQTKRKIEESIKSLHIFLNLIDEKTKALSNALNKMTGNVRNDLNSSIEFLRGCFENFCHDKISGIQDLMALFETLKNLKKKRLRIKIGKKSFLLL